MMRFLDLGSAVYLCLFLAAASVCAAFIGDKASSRLMSHPVALTAVLLFMHGLLFSGFRSLKRKRFDSALLHLGAACILAGWVIGQFAIRRATPEHPVKGSMALVDGDISDRLYAGATLTEEVGRVPFSIRLLRFSVERYGDAEQANQMPIREYCSRVEIREPGKTPRVAEIRVNQPAYVAGYHIYQMSWGETKDYDGRPVTYTVLTFIRDPGLLVVYAGYIILMLGVTAFMLRLFRRERPAPQTV